MPSRALISRERLCTIDFRAWNRDTFTVSPDGSRHAFTAVADGKWLVVVDGKAGKPYNTVGCPTFSPDGRHVAFVAKLGENSRVVVDGEEGEEYFAVAHGRIAFDPPDKLHFLVMREGSTDLERVEESLAA
jgi:dipeptidyl aminopeptidase/acylaminoacyl peptidase